MNSPCPKKQYDHPPPRVPSAPIKIRKSNRFRFDEKKGEDCRQSLARRRLNFDSPNKSSSG